MHILLAVDGSAVATRAVKHVAKLAASMAKPPKVTLLFADEPLLRSVAVSLGAQGVEKYHADNAAYATRQARTALNRAKIAFKEDMRVGTPAPTIVKAAKELKADLIVMGSRGHTALASVFLGSVATKVIAESPIPVTVVR